MFISFSGSELTNIAIDIERRGAAFYDIMIRTTDNDATRKVFQYLANLEKQHIKIFQKILAEIDKNQIPEAYTQEYSYYLQALVDSAVFTDDFISSEMATRTASDIEALELAISAEKDSILFYYGMRDMMHRRAQPTVNKIITEEKSHLRQLSELKKKLAAI